MFGIPNAVDAEGAFVAEKKWVDVAKEARRMVEETLTQLLNFKTENRNEAFWSVPDHVFQGKTRRARPLDSPH